MVKIWTAKDGTRFQFRRNYAGDILIFKTDERYLYTSIKADVAENDDEHFQREIAGFMDVWDQTNPTKLR